MKSALEKWLSPEEESEEVATAPVAPVTQTPASNFSLNTTKVKQTKADAFDSMFDEGSKKTDDLPF